MKLKTFARRAAAAGAVLAALTLAALPALAAPKVQVSTTNAVADHADILSDETEQYVNDVSIKLSDACGAQIVVVTTDFLDGMDIEDYAYTIFNNWKIGDADKNNGVLLLLAIGEENYWCMQGKGLESALTSGMIDDILWNDLEEDFAAGDYDSGARKTFDALYTVVYDYYDVGAAEGAAGNTVSDEDADWTMGTIIGLLIIIAVLIDQLSKGELKKK